MKHIVVFRILGVLVEPFDEVEAFNKETERLLRRRLGGGWKAAGFNKTWKDAVNKDSKELDADKILDTFDTCINDDAYKVWRNDFERAKDEFMQRINEDEQERHKRALKIDYLNNVLPRTRINEETLNTLKDVIIATNQEGKSVFKVEFADEECPTTITVTTMLVHNGIDPRVLNNVRVFESLDKLIKSLNAEERKDTVVFGRETDVAEMNNLGIKCVVGTNDIWGGIRDRCE